jgi:hypothetical protein
VEDFNQDGHMDVIFVAEADEMHALYFGDGKGGFVNRTNRLPRSWRSQARLLLNNTLVAKPTSLWSTPYIIQGR